MLNGDLRLCAVASPCPLRETDRVPIPRPSLSRPPRVTFWPKGPEAFLSPLALSFCVSVQSTHTSTSRHTDRLCVGRAHWSASSAFWCHPLGPSQPGGLKNHPGARRPLRSAAAPERGFCPKVSIRAVPLCAFTHTGIALKDSTCFR